MGLQTSIIPHSALDNLECAIIAAASTVPSCDVYWTGTGMAPQSRSPSYHRPDISPASKLFAGSPLVASEGTPTHNLGFMFLMETSWFYPDSQSGVSTGPRALSLAVLPVFDLPQLKCAWLSKRRKGTARKLLEAPLSFSELPFGWGTLCGENWFLTG